MRRIRKPVVLSALVAGILVLSALPGKAQRRAVVRQPGRRSVVVFAGVHRAPLYSPFFWRSAWYPYYWGAYPYAWGAWYPHPAAYYGQWYPGPRDRAAIQLQVKPPEAQVYVDGYYAGTVDDFDGRLQRLRVRAGEREITIFLEGYRTIRETVRISPGQDLKVERQMEPLGPGETSEPPPAPAPESREEPRGEAYPPSRQGPPERPGLYPPSPPPRPSWPETPAVQAPAGFGTIAIRVQPAGADILIDGERWQGPEGHDRISVQVAEGTHKVEIHKEGFVPYVGEVEVRQGETTPINVSLPPKRIEN